MMAGPIIVEIEPWWSKYFRKIRGLGFTGPLRGVRLKKLRVLELESLVNISAAFRGEMCCLSAQPVCSKRLSYIFLT